jgi:hypothetical protein
MPGFRIGERSSDVTRFAIALCTPAHAGAGSVARILTTTSGSQRTTVRHACWPWPSGSDDAKTSPWRIPGDCAAEVGGSPRSVSREGIQGLKPRTPLPAGARHSATLAGFA